MALQILNNILSAGKKLAQNTQDAAQSVAQGVQKGYQRGVEELERREAGRTVNAETGFRSKAGRPEGSIFHPAFYRSLATGSPSRPGIETIKDPVSGRPVKRSVMLPASTPITLQKNPAQFLGAFIPNLATDLEANNSRGVMWLGNHPVPIIDELNKRAGGTKYIDNYNTTQNALIGLAGITPVVASMGTFDIFNPGEAFRSKGYAQEYSEVGTDDRRETEMPVQEAIQRIIMARQGSTLKLETAQEDIPGLTKERYDNYQRFRYNDKGLLDLGIIKATDENLEGVPEARWFGFPINIPTVSAAAGMIAGGKIVSHVKPPGTLGAVAIKGGSAMAGAMLGNFVNEIIATANRPKLPDLKSYEQQYSIAPVDYSQRVIG